MSKLCNCQISIVLRHEEDAKTGSTVIGPKFSTRAKFFTCQFEKVYGWFSPRATKCHASLHDGEWHEVEYSHQGARNYYHSVSISKRHRGIVKKSTNFDRTNCTRSISCLVEKKSGEYCISAYKIIFMSLNIYWSSLYFNGIFLFTKANSRITIYLVAAT